MKALRRQIIDKTSNPAPRTGHRVHHWAWEFLRLNEDYRALCAAADRRAAAGRTSSESDCRKVWDFWVILPWNPDTPSHEFSFWYWHADYVPFATSLLLNYGEQFGTPSLTVYPKSTLAREAQHRLLDQVLDQLEAPTNNSRGRSHEISNFPKYQAAYLLWKHHHIENTTAGLTWDQIGEMLEPGTQHNPGQRARTFCTTAKALIDGGYKKLLTGGDPLSDTTVSPGAGLPDAVTQLLGSFITA